MKSEDHVVHLMITNGEKWHYFAVKKFSALLRGITSNNNGDFYCINCLHSFRTEKAQKAWKYMQKSWLLVCSNA